MDSPDDDSLSQTQIWDLPVEIWVLVMDLLDVKSLRRLSLVSHRMQELCELCWRHKCLEKYGEVVIPVVTNL